MCCLAVKTDLLIAKDLIVVWSDLVAYWINNAFTCMIISVLKSNHSLGASLQFEIVTE